MYQEIRLHFTDFPGETNILLMLKILRKRFNIILDPQNPDYLIYSLNGHNHLKYGECIKIFFTAENFRPDFNLCDYAIGYDYINFDDRYLRFPNYALYDEWFDILRRKKSFLATKKKFCNFIYTNGSEPSHRDNFFRLLSEYKFVDSLGRHLKNSDLDIAAPYNGNWSGAKVAAQTEFKFTIAFENGSFPGYSTEKIVHALAADTIPIYWGDPNVERVFNSRRFINANGKKLEAVVDEVKRINEDQSIYQSMMKEPFFADNFSFNEISENTFVNFFKNIFSQPLEQARRRCDNSWTRRYESNLSKSCGCILNKNVWVNFDGSKIRASLRRLMGKIYKE